MYKYEIFHYTRKNRRVSLKQLADELNITAGYLSLIEKGHRKLSYDMAVKIASYFNESPDDLFLSDHLQKKEVTEQ